MLCLSVSRSLSVSSSNWKWKGLVEPDQRAGEEEIFRAGKRFYFPRPPGAPASLPLSLHMSTSSQVHMSTSPHVHMSTSPHFHKSTCPHVLFYTIQQFPISTPSLHSVQSTHTLYHYCALPLCCGPQLVGSHCCPVHCTMCTLFSTISAGLLKLGHILKNNICINIFFLALRDALL